MQTDGAAVGVIETVVRFAFDWAGWIVAAAVAVAAGLTAWAALRSARAAEQSLEESRRSAEASADVTSEAFRHTHEAEARRIRSKVALTAANLESAYAEAKDLAEQLLSACRTVSALHGNTELDKRAIAEAEKIPGELKALVDNVDHRDLAPDALRDLSIDDLENVATKNQAVRHELERRIDSMKRELRSLEEVHERELQRRDPFR